MFESIEIRSVDPLSVYIFPKRYTFEGIKKNVDILHKLADSETGGKIYCFGDDLNYKPEHDFEICYPMLKNDFKKYNIHDFKVLQRIDAVTGIFTGKYNEITPGLLQLEKYATEHGYKVLLPYCISYKKGKTPKFSKTPPPYEMKFVIPVIKIDE